MWQGLANCYTKLSRHTDAIKAYKRAVLDGSTDLSILVTLASLLEQEGDLKSAASFHNQIISETTVPGTGELTPMAAKSHLWHAKMEIKNGDFDEAERHVNEALKGHYVHSDMFLTDIRNWTRQELCKEKLEGMLKEIYPPLSMATNDVQKVLDIIANMNSTPSYAIFSNLQLIRVHIFYNVV
jgi:Tetratricopeptide repeat